MDRLAREVRQPVLRRALATWTSSQERGHRSDRYLSNSVASGSHFFETDSGCGENGKPPAGGTFGGNYFPAQTLGGCERGLGGGFGTRDIRHKATYRRA